MDGPCVVPANHAKGAVCISQAPPNTNPDDTLPGFTLSTFYEAYLRYKAYGWNGELGNLLFNTPWANPSDSRVKPAAFQGAYLGYTWASGLTVEGADMIAFENRTSSAFSQQTLLTSYPAGGGGLASNIYVPGGQGINTNGFGFGKVGYSNPSGVSVDGYYYGVSDLTNMWWFDGKYTFKGKWAPYVALQGGWENNAGQSYIGKIDSQMIGAQIGANVTKNLLLTGGYDNVPWHNDSVYLPTNVTCSNSNYQISAKGATLGLLPAAQRGAVLHAFERPDRRLLRGLGQPVHGQLCHRPDLHDEHFAGHDGPARAGHVLEGRAAVHVNEQEVDLPGQRRVV